MDKLGETLLNKQARRWKNPLHHSRVESKKFQLIGVENGMEFPQAGGQGEAAQRDREVCANDALWYISKECQKNL